MRRWCQEQGIGRRIGGTWRVSKVALTMLLEGDNEALQAYRDLGVRAQFEPVAGYFCRAGLSKLLELPGFGAVEKLGADDIDPAAYTPKAAVEDPDLDCPPDSPPDNEAPNVEAVGFIETDKINPDRILASVADDPEVKEAAARWDRATPSTHYDLVRARDEAQARTGIPVANRAFLYSAEVDTDLLPIVMCMGRGDEAATAQALTRDFNERYREFGQRVLAF